MFSVINTLRIILLFITFILVMIGAFFSCNTYNLSDCPNCPQVLSIHPDSAHFGDTVVILGKNLLPDSEYNDVLEVRFNGKLIPEANIEANYTDSIILIIPKGTESGPVTVDLNVEDELISKEIVSFKYLLSSNVSTFAGNGFIASFNETMIM